MKKDDQVKLNKYYSSEDMQYYIRLMEMFASKLNDIALTPEQLKVCNAMVNHYRRMCVSILMKEFPINFESPEAMTMSEAESIIKAYSA